MKPEETGLEDMRVLLYAIFILRVIFISIIFLPLQGLDMTSTFPWALLLVGLLHGGIYNAILAPKFRWALGMGSFGKRKNDKKKANPNLSERNLNETENEFYRELALAYLALRFSQLHCACC